MERFAPAQDERDSGPLRLPHRGPAVGDQTVADSDRSGRAFSTARASRCTLTIVGGGSLESELRQMLGAKESRGLVTLRGRIESDQMPDVYRAHDLFVKRQRPGGA